MPLLGIKKHPSMDFQGSLGWLLLIKLLGQKVLNCLTAALSLAILGHFHQRIIISSTHFVFVIHN